MKMEVVGNRAALKAWVVIWHLRSEGKAVGMRNSALGREIWRLIELLGGEVRNARVEADCKGLGASEEVGPYGLPTCSHEYWLPVNQWHRVDTEINFRLTSGRQPASGNPEGSRT